MSRRVLLDTGPLVAALNRRDQDHKWAVEQFRKGPLPFLTCEAVLTEAAYMLSGNGADVGAMLDLLDSGTVRVIFEVEPEAQTIKAVMAQYANVPMDFADACLVRMAERYPDTSILTLDSDFYIYRRNGKHALSVIRP